MPRTWLVGGLVACALFGGGVSLFSSPPAAPAVGSFRRLSHALAALVVLAWRSRATFGVDVALAVLICGAILVPLLWMVATGHGEPEVGVVRVLGQDTDQARHPVQEPEGAGHHH